MDDLRSLLKKLEEHRITAGGELQEFDYGLFVDIVDPEGNKIKLWKPNDKQFRKRS